MKEQISQMMDGEMDDDQARHFMGALQYGDHMGEWGTYHLIGDALRETPPLSDGFMERFRATLADEPTVMAPHRRLPGTSRPRAIALSMAASVAAVGVVVWAVMQSGAMNPVPPLVTAKAPQETLASSAVSPYLLAHQEYSPSIAMQGMAPYIRTVSQVREGAGQ